MRKNENIPEYDTTMQNPDDTFYQTGRTRPPKSFGGLIAILLVAVIFLGGIASAMGILNIKLSRQMTAGGKSSVSFSEGEADGKPNKPIVPNASGSDITIQLNQTPESVDNIPQSGGLSLQDIYQKNIDSVVSIFCKVPNGSSSGTGVIISQNGYVITNAHVVGGATSIEIMLTGGQCFPARTIGADIVSDLAVLYIEASDLSAAEFGDSSSLRVGDAVVAIGDPLGVELRGTMTDGIVSAINRDIAVSGRTMTLVQTNAALNSGNSGGPLINCFGQVIGINTMKVGDYMDDAGVEGLGFAIPSATVKEVVDQLIRQGYVTGRPSLGLSTETVSGFLQMYYNLPKGVYITAVEKNSDAAKKGLAVGDILLSLDSQRITDTETLNAQLFAHNAGETVTAVIYRAGNQYAVELVLGQATK